MENLSVKDPNIEEIYLAGGCFWGTEEYIKRIKGVIETKVGYINGDTEYVTYEEVCNNSGHAEAVYIKFDANIISLDSLLTEYYRTIDPTSLGRQGMDIGVQYRTGIYYTCESHRPQIEDSIKILQKKYQHPIVIEVEPLKHFCLAEEVHQNYLTKNPKGYCHINFKSIEKQREEENL